MIEDRIKDITAAGQAAWDEAADIHKEYTHKRLLKCFSQPGGVAMLDIVRQTLLEHGIKDKAVFQPCCNNAREILSIKNLGAAHCMGFDLSNEFIKQAKEFAQAGNIDCELTQADAYNMDSRYDEMFDICMISLGTFMWLPDIDLFFAMIARLLRKNGWVFIHEFHPIAEIYTRNKQTRTIELSRSYFNQEPYLVSNGLDYFGWKNYQAKPCYHFLHKISDIIQAMIDNGFTIESFKERPVDMGSAAFTGTDPTKSRLPLSYIMTSVKHS